MNQYFLDQIILLLKGGFGRTISDQKNNLVKEPSALPISGIMIRPGELNVEQAGQDKVEKEVHPVRFREEFKVIKSKLNGPYELDITSINERLSCKVVYPLPDDEVEELEFNYGTDFSKNESNELIFNKSLTGASLFYVDYEVSGTSTVSNFNQDIWLDIYDDDAMTTDKYGAIAASVLLTKQFELLDRFNTLKSAEYGGTRFKSLHRITALRWCSAIPQNGENNWRLTLQFQIEGYIQHIRIMDKGIATIKEVPILLKEPV